MSTNDRKRKIGSISPPPLKRPLQSTTTRASVASFFTPTSQKAPEQTTWTIIDKSLVVGHHKPLDLDERARNQPKRRKIAAFDLDSTLIKTTSGKRFPDSSADWGWWHLSVPQTLKKLDEEGHHVVIVSNQGGISLSTDSKTPKGDMKRFADFKSKLSTIMSQLSIPISVYAATQKDVYRKPRSGSWREIVEYLDLDDAEGPDMENSFFVGDAGGRMADVVSSDVDFSSSDRDFAANVGIKYFTPEEYFLKAEVRPFIRSFEPSSFLDKEVMRPSIDNSTQNLIVFCGSPGSGKSTFFETMLKSRGYERVNQDILKSRDKCVAVATKHLSDGKSVAVDNTNADEPTRKVWIELAQRHKLPVRCILFITDAKLCQHNDAVRALNPIMNPEKRAMLPGTAFAGFTKRYTKPTLEEGFAEILTVDFGFQGSAEQREIWSRYHI